MRRGAGISPGPRRDRGSRHDAATGTGALISGERAGVDANDRVGASERIGFPVGLSGSLIHSPLTTNLYRYSPRGNGFMKNQHPRRRGSGCIGSGRQSLNSPAIWTEAAPPAFSSKRTPVFSQAHGKAHFDVGIAAVLRARPDGIIDSARRRRGIGRGFGSAGGAFDFEQARGFAEAFGRRSGRFGPGIGKRGQRRWGIAGGCGELGFFRGEAWRADQREP
jgi:hypothetical protein